jgi:hypothetical protein
MTLHLFEPNRLNDATKNRLQSDENNDHLNMIVFVGVVISKCHMQWGLSTRPQGWMWQLDAQQFLRRPAAMIDAVSKSDQGSKPQPRTSTS